MKKNIKLLSSLVGLTTLSSLIPLCATANSSAIVNKEVISNDMFSASASVAFSQPSGTPQGTIYYEGATLTDVSENFSIENATLNEYLPNVSYIDTISDSAFESCTGIVGCLSFPRKNFITEIKSSAFDGCSKLTEFKLEGAYDPNQSVWLPGENPYISFIVSANAFNGCSSLNTFCFPMIQGSFDKGYVNFDQNWLGDATGREITIHVPKGMIETYKNYLKHKTCGATFTFIDDLENPEYSNLNLPLVLGLSLGIGIPVLAGAIGGTIYGVKKHKAKK